MSQQAGSSLRRGRARDRGDDHDESYSTSHRYTIFTYMLCTVNLINTQCIVAVQNFTLIFAMRNFGKWPLVFKKRVIKCLKFISTFYKRVNVSKFNNAGNILFSNFLLDLVL